MKLNDLFLIEEALDKLQLATLTKPSEIVEALTGVAWDEEAAGDITQFLEDR